MNGRRGFTLLELVIGSTISLAIASIAMGVLLLAQSTQRETQLKNAVTRDAMYVLDMIGGDIGFAGVGVPFGTDVDNFAGRLRPVFRVGDTRSLAFIGDLPLPNADANGLTVLADMPPGNTVSAMAVVSELGLCAPSSGVDAFYDCNSTVGSLIALGPIAGSDECGSVRMDARSCPWGLGKWQRDDDSRLLVIMSAPDGRWAQRSVRLGPANGPLPVGVNALVGMGFDGGPVPRGTFAQPRLGATTVATIDRVFYSLEKLSGGACDASAINCVLLRRQCWGEVFDPAAPGYPFPGAPAVTSSQSPAGCTAPQAGTRWETVASGIESLTFRYFDVDGAVLTTPLSAAALEAVAAVEADLVISRRIPSSERFLKHRLTRRWFVDAGDAFGQQGRH